VFSTIIVERMLYGQFIAIEAKTAYNTLASGSDERVVAVFFASEDVAEVDFDFKSWHA
jgi:hypothetical protein